MIYLELSIKLNFFLLCVETLEMQRQINDTNVKVVKIGQAAEKFAAGWYQTLLEM